MKPCPKQWALLHHSWCTTLVILATILVEVTAHSIICYTCKEQVSNWKCLGMTICSEQEQQCNDSKVLITKTYAEKCPSERDYPDRVLSSLFCCECSWCNIQPPK
ncbi:lymphocyte antigen 6E-like [Python bivittatus]|uniref:Lymphocyte antigen 6E-like n=1 Tax=Python bivittatus TaxID=176946 RepID=A0A9F5IYR9_PYTBI|nr:lymphocyte antigen 6E-like [Python bivittatus]